MKDSCSVVSKLLEKYFDQEVTEQERSFVEIHLQGCTACQDSLKSMEKLRVLVKAPLDEAVQEETFPWVWEKVERGIRQQERPTFWETLRSWVDITPLFRRSVWIPAVAAAVILILVTIPLFFKKTPSYSEPSVIEYVESQTYNVMVYDLEKAKVTLIWLFEEPEEEAATI